MPVSILARTRLDARIACLSLALCALLFGVRPIGAEPPVDINTADVATLAARLPGIGPVKAAAIVDHRVRHGGFVSVDRLIEVRGIGVKTLDAIRELVTAGPWVESRREHGRRPVRALAEERATAQAVRSAIALAERDAASVSRR